MTHYTVDYSNMTPQAKHNKAIADIRDYLGDDKFEKLTLDFRALYVDRGLTVGVLGRYLMLAGVDGYPVRAWHAEICPYG